jgi:hypothetical protein
MRSVPDTAPARSAGERPRMVTTTEILAVIGGTTLVLTAAARLPAALAEFLRACILVATAARELRAALAEPDPCDEICFGDHPYGGGTDLTAARAEGDQAPARRLIVRGCDRACTRQAVRARRIRRNGPDWACGRGCTGPPAGSSALTCHFRMPARRRRCPRHPGLARRRGCRGRR